MQESQKEKTSPYNTFTEQGSDSREADSMASYWEKLRMDRQFNIGQKPATD
jgi:hypothetical protein